MNNNIQEQLDLLQSIMEKAMLKALIDMGDEAKNLSFFCTVEEEQHRKAILKAYDEGRCKPYADF
jgi:hypothetical protein